MGFEEHSFKTLEPEDLYTLLFDAALACFCKFFIYMDGTPDICSSQVL